MTMLTRECLRLEPRGKAALSARLAELGLAASEVRGFIDASCTFVFCGLWVRAEWTGAHGFAIDDAPFYIPGVRLGFQQSS